MGACGMVVVRGLDIRKLLSIFAFDWNMKTHFLLFYL